MIPFLVKLILAHLIGDFILQPTSWVQHKNLRSYKSIYLYLHILIHFILLLLLLWVHQVMICLIIALSHWIIDVLKIEYTRKYHKITRTAFFVDQILHLLVIVAVTYSLYYNAWNEWWINISMYKLMILLTCIILVTQVSSIVVKQIMSYWNINFNNEENSLKNAGKYIGILERILIFTFVISNQPASVGFLVAAKSIFRFNDLSRDKDRKITEYILIGTFLSFTLAWLIAWMYLYLNSFF